MRAAASYKQKPYAPFILVIKTNKPVPLSGRKKNPGGLRHSDSWQQMVILGIHESARKKSRSFPNGTAERFCKMTIPFLALAAKHWTWRKRVNMWNTTRWAARLSYWSGIQSTVTVLQETTDSPLENTGRWPLHQTVALQFLKADGLFWLVELAFETNNKTIWNFIGDVEHELSKNWDTDLYSHRTPCLNRDSSSPASLSHTDLFIHAYIRYLRPQKRTF